MLFRNFTKFILVVFFAGLIGGGIFGFMFSLYVLTIYYNIEISIILTFFVGLFYIPSIWRQIRQKNWFVIIRKLIEIVIIGLGLATLFTLEEERITFSSFDWWIIYICTPLVFIPFTLYLVLEEFYNETRIYKEINHIVKGMQIYGLLPKEKEK